MADTFDMNNFITDHGVRAIMLNDDNDIMWTITQLTELSIKCESDTKEVTDALEAPIMELDRAKKATLSGNNALFDFGLAAAQMGSQKKVASSSNKIIAPMFDEIKVGTAETVKLKHTPTAQIKYIYELRDDSTLGIKYTNGAAADESKFVHVDKSDTITIPTGLAENSRLFVEYYYETDKGIEVVDSSNKFPTTGKLLLLVVGYDPCNPETKYAAYYEFPNAKLTSTNDYTLATDGKHPFEIKCLPPYCDREKKLFRVIVPGEQFED